MSFPNLLANSVLNISKSKVYYRVADLDRTDLVAYAEWVKTLGVGEFLTPAKLRRLFRAGVYKNEISELFKKNKKHAYLGTESKYNRKISQTVVKS